MIQLLLFDVFHFRLSFKLSPNQTIFKFYNARHSISLKRGVRESYLHHHWLQMQSTYSWDCCRVVPFPTEDERQMLVGVKCVFVQRKPAKTIQQQFLWLTILQLNSTAITFFSPEIFILYIWGGEREREKKKKKNRSLLHHCSRVGNIKATDDRKW